MKYLLIGKHVQLRPLEESDIPALMQNGNDPLLRKCLGASFPSPYDLKSAKRRVMEWAKSEYGQEEFWIFVDDQFVWCGGISLGNGYEMKNMHVGYRIGEKYRNKGYASDFLQTIVDYAFAKYDLLRMWSKVYSYNPTSAKVMERVGFVREWVERDAVFCQWEIADAWIYGLTRRDWEQNQ